MINTKQRFHGNALTERQLDFPDISDLALVRVLQMGLNPIYDIWAAGYTNRMNLFEPSILLPNRDLEPRSQSR